MNDSFQPDPIRAAFLRKIREEPDIELHRLVFADWLEEQGEPYAQFIRIQCEAVRLKQQQQELRERQAELERQGKSDPSVQTEPLRQLESDLKRLTEQLRTLDQQERLLWRQRSADWCRPWMRFTLTDYMIQFRQGLPQSACMTVSSFVSYIDAIANWCCITEGDFDCLGPVKGNNDDKRLLDELAACPHLQWFRKLRLSFPLQERGALLLAGSPYLRNLRELALSFCQLGNAGVAALAGSSYLGNLRRLALGNNQLDNAGAAALADSPSLTDLQELILNNNLIGDAGAATLADSPLADSLRTLELANNQLSAAGVTALVRSGRLPQLTELVLDGNPIGVAGAEALAAAPLVNLKRLGLSRCSIGEQGAIALARSSLAARPHGLTVMVDVNRLGDGGRRALLASGLKIENREFTRDE